MIISSSASTFSFFNITIHYYSVCMLFAIFVCFAVVLHFAKKMNLNTPLIWDFTPLLVIFSVLSARLYYVLLSLNYYIQNPLEIFEIWKGGLSIHGAIIGGVIFGFFYLKAKKENFYKYADIFSCALPLGQAIGRLGNFFNEEAFGLPITGNAPIMLYISEKNRGAEFIGYEYFHPVFLYESIFDIIIFALLCVILKKTAKKYDGLTFFLYILFYSIIRLVLEFFRTDSIFYLFNLPFPAVVSFFGILIGLFFSVRIILRNH